MPISTGPSPSIIGEIAHGELRHVAKHAPIIDRSTWDAVQRLLAKNRQGTSVVKAAEPSLLAGLVTDHASRFLLACEALESIREMPVIESFERLFREHGLPAAVRSDNGVPFASPNGLYNLSKLSVWWLRLGIAIERIKPGHPQQNGRHERMHLTLEREATRPPGSNFLQQQVRFDSFVREFNEQRPHEALAMKCPPEIYIPSPPTYQGLPDVDYPFHDRDVLVTACGRIRMHRKRVNISTVFDGQKLGIKEIDDGIWLVSYLDYDLGYIDLEQKTLQTLDNPFGLRLLPMS